MKQKIVTKLSDETRNAISIEVDFPDSLVGLVELYGEEIIFNRTLAALRIDLQAHVRSRMRATNDDGSFVYKDKEIITSAAEWKPSTRKRAKSQEEKAKDILKGLSKEELQKILDGLDDAE